MRTRSQLACQSEEKEVAELNVSLRSSARLHCSAVTSTQRGLRRVSQSVDKLGRNSSVVANCSRRSLKDSHGDSGCRVTPDVRPGTRFESLNGAR
jgi:hypothetical protein